MREKIAKRKALKKEKLNQKTAMEDVDRKRKLDTKESKPAKKVRVESEREESEKRKLETKDSKPAKKLRLETEKEELERMKIELKQKTGKRKAIRKQKNRQ